MLVLHPAKQDLTERNPYWQLHMLNATGFPIEKDFMTDQSYLPLLWAWHVLQSSQEVCIISDLNFPTQNFNGR